MPSRAPMATTTTCCGPWIRRAGRGSHRAASCSTSFPGSPLGAIILFHVGSGSTDFAALPAVIAGLRASGYGSAHLSQCCPSHAHPRACAVEVSMNGRLGFEFSKHGGHGLRVLTVRWLFARPWVWQRRRCFGTSTRIDGRVEQCVPGSPRCQQAGVGPPPSTSCRRPGSSSQASTSSPKPGREERRCCWPASSIGSPRMSHEPGRCPAGRLLERLERRDPARGQHGRAGQDKGWRLAFYLLRTVAARRRGRGRHVRLSKPWPGTTDGSRSEPWFAEPAAWPRPRPSGLA